MLVLALVACPAAAETVEHTYTGVVQLVSDGVVGGTLDLPGTFSAGQAATIVTTIERSAVGAPFVSGGIYYLAAVTEWSVSVGPYTRTPGPANLSSGILVANDLAAAPASAPRRAGETLGDVVDFLPVSIPITDSPPVGSATPHYLVIDLVDDDATQFADAPLPRTMPDISGFKTATWTLQFVDAGLVGVVSGTLSSISTSTRPATWGRPKVESRD